MSATRDTGRFAGVPDIIYGTAFKFEESQRLVEAALEAGFRAIDTAGSATAYREKLVGDGIRAVLSKGVITRKDIYIQTKFSPFKEGKDPALYPYDVEADVETKVKQSIESSLANLGTTYIDCLVLHSLCTTLEETLSTWRAMEAYVPSKVASLGVSNTDLATLHIIFDAAVIKPSAVQNRFTEDIASKPNPELPSNLPYPEDPYDRVVRTFCFAHDITYAPWGLLWGNPTLLEKMEIFVEMAKEFNVTKEVACFACMRSLSGCNVSILCGTTKPNRMQETLEGMKLIAKSLGESGHKRRVWQEHVAIVRRVVNGTEPVESI